MRSLGGCGFLAMFLMTVFLNINLADVVLNRARNIDSQFGSEQRKAGRSVFFASSSEKKKFRLSYFSPSILPFLIRSFFPIHRFERHSAVTWLFPLARGKGSLHSLSSSTILYNLFCYFVFRLSLFFFLQNAFPPLYMHLIECEI